MVEQAAVNRKVEGSSPSLGANFFKNAHRGREPERAESSGEAFCAEHELSGFSLRSKREPLPRSQFFSAFSRLYKLSAGVAELADAQDLKSCDPYRSYRFDPGLRHQFIFLHTRKYAGIIYKDLEYTIIDIAG